MRVHVTQASPASSSRAMQLCRLSCPRAKCAVCPAPGRPATAAALSSATRGMVGDVTRATSCSQSLSQKSSLPAGWVEFGGGVGLVGRWEASRVACEAVLSCAAARCSYPTIQLMSISIRLPTHPSPARTAGSPGHIRGGPSALQPPSVVRALLLVVVRAAHLRGGTVDPMARTDVICPCHVGGQPPRP